jgi:hypothetical protein
MDPNACLCTLASEELLRPSLKSHSPSDIFSVNGGSIAAPQAILTAAFSAGPVQGSPATPSGRWEKGAGSQVVAIPTSGSWDGL